MAAKLETMEEVSIGKFVMYTDSFGGDSITTPQPGTIVFIQELDDSFSRQPYKVTDHGTLVQIGDAD